MKDLIDDVFVAAFDNPLLAPLEDQARFDLAELAAHGDRLAFTTDSFVVDPLFFPGGDIGKLAVCGTVNDLAVGGATPLYLSCAVIIEEGVAIDTAAPGRALDGGDRASGRRSDRHRRHQGRAARRLRQAVHHHHRHRRDPRGRSTSARIRRGRATSCWSTACSAIMARPSSARAATWRSTRRSRAIARRCTDLIETLLAAAPGDPLPARPDARRTGDGAQRDRRGVAGRDRDRRGARRRSARRSRRSARSSGSIRSISPTKARSSSIVPPEQAEAALAAMRAHPLGAGAAVIGQRQAR